MLTLRMPQPTRRERQARPTPWTTSACALLLCVVSASVAVPTWAQQHATVEDPAAQKRKQAAMGALNLANLRYEEGKFDEAATLYLQAWDLHREPAFLFNAARAEMRAFALDWSEAHFRDLLALPQLDAQVRKHVELHLDEIAAYRAKIDEERRRAAAEAARKTAEAPEPSARASNTTHGAATTTVRGAGRLHVRGVSAPGPARALGLNAARPVPAVGHETDASVPGQAI